jgi:hypothetical protein
MGSTDNDPIQVGDLTTDTRCNDCEWLRYERAEIYRNGGWVQATSCTVYQQDNGSGDRLLVCLTASNLKGTKT